MRWPAYYLDFETTTTVVPVLPGLAPREQFSTQYSIHVDADLDAEREHRRSWRTTRSMTAAGWRSGCIELRREIGDGRCAAHFGGRFGETIPARAARSAHRDDTWTILER